MTVNVTDTERVHLLAVREVARAQRGRLAAAVAADAVAFPRAALDELIGMGYLRWWMPVADGGDGVSLAAFCALTEEVCSGWPAVGLLLVMPPACIATYLYPEERVPADHLAEWRQQRALAFGELAAGRVIAAGNSELGISDIDHSQAVAEEDGDGWLISGQKVFGSWGQHSHWMQTTARTPTVERNGDQVTQFFIATTGPGVTWRRDWNALGMSETESHSFVLERAPAPWAMGFPGVRAHPTPTGWGALPFAAVGLGCVRGLLEPLLAGSGGYGPSVRGQLADCIARYEALHGYLLTTAGECGPVSSPALVQRVNRTKAYVSREAVALAAELFALGGGRALAANDIAGKYLRDAFASTGLRPPLRAIMETWGEGLDAWVAPTV